MAFCKARAAGDQRRWLRAPEESPRRCGGQRAASEIRFSCWQPLAGPVSCLAGAGRAGKDTEGWCLTYSSEGRP